MPSYTISIPTSVIVTIEADNADAALNEEALEQAVLAQYGKRIDIDAKNLGFDEANLLYSDADK